MHGWSLEKTGRSVGKRIRTAGCVIQLVASKAARVLLVPSVCQTPVMLAVHTCKLAYLRRAILLLCTAYRREVNTQLGLLAQPADSSWCATACDIMSGAR